MMRGFCSSSEAQRLSPISKTSTERLMATAVQTGPENSSAKSLPVKVIFLALALSLFLSDANAASLKTQNVFLIITDGFRWQEVFTGAEEQLMTKETGVVKA